MAEPWEDAIKSIGVQLNAAQQELTAAKKENASKAELKAIRDEIGELTKELKALKEQGKGGPKKEPEPEPTPTPTPDDADSWQDGFFPRG